MAWYQSIDLLMMTIMRKSVGALSDTDTTTVHDLVVTGSITLPSLTTGVKGYYASSETDAKALALNGLQNGEVRVYLYDHTYPNQFERKLVFKDSSGTVYKDQVSIVMIQN